MAKVLEDNKEIHADLVGLDVDEMLIWHLEPGEKLNSAHPVRNTMRACARIHKRKFATLQRGAKVYVIRVE